MIKWFNSESTDLDDIVKLCLTASDDDRPAAINMRLNNWRNSPHTLLYKLINDKTFDTGGYGLIYQSDQPVAGSGFYKSIWSEDIFVTAARAYTLPNVKDGFNYLQGEIWHTQLDMARKDGCKIAIMTFNDYNKDLLDISIRINDHHNWSTSFCENGIWYRKPGRRIQPLKKIDYPIMFNYTKQWVLYTVFDNDYEDKFLRICEENRYDQ